MGRSSPEEDVAEAWGADRQPSASSLLRRFEWRRSRGWGPIGSHGPFLLQLRCAPLRRGVPRAAVVAAAEAVCVLRLTECLLSVMWLGVSGGAMLCRGGRRMCVCMGWLLSRRGKGELGCVSTRSSVVSMGGPNVPIGPSCGLLHCRLAVDVQARAGAACQSVGRMCGRDVSTTGYADRGIQSAGKLAERCVARGIGKARQCDWRVLGAGVSKVRGI